MISDFSFVAGCLFNCGMVDFFSFTVSCWCVVCVADTFTVLSNLLHCECCHFGQGFIRSCERLELLSESEAQSLAREAPATPDIRRAEKVAFMSFWILQKQV